MANLRHNNGVNKTLPPPSLLELDLPQAIIFTCITTTTSLLGIVGNILIILVYLTNKKLKKSRNAFIVNLAVADFIGALISNSLCTIIAVKGMAFVAESLYWIGPVDVVCLITCFCTILNQTAGAGTRYIQINYSAAYRNIINKRNSIIGCISIWMFCTCIGAGNYLSWGYPSSGLKVATCLSDQIKAGVYYMAYIAMGLVLICVSLVVFFYSGIFTKIYKSKLTVFSGAMLPGGNYSKAWFEAAKTSKSLFLIFIAFAVCWVPYASVILIDLHYPLSPTVHLWVTWLSHFHGAINIFIYIFVDTRFRVGFMQMFGMQHNHVHPAPMQVERPKQGQYSLNSLKIPNRTVIYHQHESTSLEMSEINC